MVREVLDDSRQLMNGMSVQAWKASIAGRQCFLRRVGRRREVGTWKVSDAMHLSAF